MECLCLSVRPLVSPRRKVWITYIQAYMPHESSEDSSNQPDGPMGSHRCPPWPPRTLYAYHLTSWDPVGLPFDPLGMWIGIKDLLAANSFLFTPSLTCGLCWQFNCIFKPVLIELLPRLQTFRPLLFQLLNVRLAGPTVKRPSTGCFTPPYFARWPT